MLVAKAMLSINFKQLDAESFRNLLLHFLDETCKDECVRQINPYSPSSLKTLIKSTPSQKLRIRALIEASPGTHVTVDSLPMEICESRMVTQFNKKPGTYGTDFRDIFRVPESQAG